MAEAGTTTAAPAPTGQVLIVNPTTGKRGMVPKSELDLWTQAGYQPESIEQTTDAQLEQEYGDSPIQAGLEGAARGVTLGLSDVALGQLDREGINERRNRNQGAAIAGEVGGALLGGGMPLAPAGMATRAGVGAERATVGLVGAGKAGSAVQRYAPALVRGGAEGAIYGAGTGVSNVALSKDPMSAESIVGEIGSEALLGFGIGAGLGVGGQALHDSANYAKAYTKRLTTPTIADEVIAAAPVPGVKVDPNLERIAQRPPRQSGETRAALEAERDALASGQAARGPLKPTELPKGWTDDALMSNGGNTKGWKPVEGMPSWKDLDFKNTGFEDRLYVIPVDDLERAGIHANPGAIGDSKMPGLAKARREGVELPPVYLEMDESGQFFVQEGRHRLTTLLEEGQNAPIVARIERRSAPSSSHADDTILMARGADGRVAEMQPGKGGAGKVDSDTVIEKFKTDYHRQDTVGRQQIRQMESMEARGLPITPEMRAAAADVEASRRAMRQFLPLESERSYESLLAGDLGGSYAKGQGKSLQTWTGDNKAIAEAVRKEGFRDAVAANQEAIDHMQGLLGNKAYPPVIGEHPVYALGDIEAQAAAKTKALEEVNAKLDRLEKVLASDSSAAVKQRHFDETVALAESRGMSVTEQQLNAKIKEAGFEGVTVADLPTAELNRLKAETYRQMAKDELALTRAQAREKVAAAKKAEAKLAKAEKAKAKEKESGGILGQLMGDSVGDKIATGAGAALGSALGVGPWIGGLAGRAVLGNPLRRITEAMSGKAGAGMAKLAAGVDAFLGAAGKAGKFAPRGTMAILEAASFRTDDHDKQVKGSAFDKRTAELAKAAADPQHTRQQIHASLAGVRMADPLLADQMEELAFNRLMFLADRMPKTPIVGSAVGKRKDIQPTDAEKAKFARYVDAAEHPEHVVEDLRHGTVTLEQAETLETLYPATYSAIRGDIVSRAAELQSTLDWDQRLSLSVLFKTPADSVMRVSTVAAMQANFVAPEPDKPVPAGSMPSVKAPQVTPAQRMASGGNA
jgi:hypothetical protein